MKHTETEIVKRLTSRGGETSRTLVPVIHTLLTEGYPGWWGRSGDAVSRILKRVRKKAKQPFRRKRRAPLRRSAAGKNEVRPSRGSRC